MGSTRDRGGRGGRAVGRGTGDRGPVYAHPPSVCYMIETRTGTPSPRRSGGGYSSGMSYRTPDEVCLCSSGLGEDLRCRVFGKDSPRDRGEGGEVLPVSPRHLRRPQRCWGRVSPGPVPVSLGTSRSTSATCPTSSRCSSFRTHSPVPVYGPIPPQRCREWIPSLVR